MRKEIIAIIMIGFLLLSSVTSITAQAHPNNVSKHFFKPVDFPIAYKWHYLTSKDAKNLIDRARSAENENLKIVDGKYYTGLKPPSPKIVDPLIGNAEVIDSTFIPRSLPSSIDLSKDPRFPAVGNQGQQGSCAAWAVTYYNEGWTQAYIHNWTDAHYGTDKHHLMSPAWTYNKVNGGSDEGSDFISNMMVLSILGGATLYIMPYNPQDAISWGDEDAWREAPLYRIDDFGIINVTQIINAPTGTYNPPTSQQVQNLTNVIKSFLAEGHPVNFAIDASQYTSIFGNGNYIISYSEYNAAGEVNHAQTIVGYNDSITDNGDKGAFKVVNSWGATWGEGGYYWITYKAMYKILAMGNGYPYAFVLFPRIHYEPKLLGVWTLDPNYRGSRLTPIDLGIGSPDRPIEIERSVFGNSSSYNGGNHPFPTFLAVDLTDFMDNISFNHTNEFFLYAHSGNNKMVIDSFHIEYYDKRYVPYHPTQVSENSPDTPATQDASHPAIVRVYFKPLRKFHTIKIDSNSDFDAIHGVIAGNGTKDDPYIISGWKIDAHGSNFGIYIGNVTAYFIIEGNYIYNASHGTGIYLYNTTHGYIKKNKIYDNYYGILFSKSYYNTIDSNDFFKNTHSLYIITSTNSLYYNQTIYTNNTVDEKPIYYFANKNNITIKNIEPGYLGVFHSANINIENITLNGSEEIFLEYDINVSVINSYIENTHWGLALRYSSEIKVWGNYFIKNIYSITAYGIRESTIENNSFLHNYNGLRIVNSYKNKIYHNNFISNKYQAYDNSNNTWSLSPPVGGNYWSDYNGSDTNHDGFGDIPYPIPGDGAKDYYPLLKPWDNIPPKVDIVFPKNGEILGESSLTIYWKGEDNLAISSYYLKIDDSIWMNVGNKTKYTLSNLENGNHTVYVKAEDLSGNIAIAKVSFNIDTIPPKIEFISPSENSYLNHSKVLIKWRVEDENKVSFIISIDNHLPISLGTKTEYMAENLNSGKHTVTLTGFDAAGNSDTKTLEFYVDTIPPEIFWNMSIPSGGWINKNNITLRWKATDNLEINYTEIKIDTQGWIDVGKNNSYFIQNISDGKHIIYLKVYDMAGNYNTSSFIFNVDTKKPKLNITSPQNNLITNDTSIKIRWRGEDNIGIRYYEVRINNGTWVNLGNLTETTLYLNDGKYTIYIRASDFAGNYIIKSITVIIDTLPPQITIISPSPNTNISKNFVVVSWKGNDNVGIAYYKVKIDNSSWIKIGTKTSYNFTNLKDGLHTVFVKVVDRAGNSKVASTTFRIKSQSIWMDVNDLIGSAIGLSIIVIILILILVAVIVTKKKSKSR